MKYFITFLLFFFTITVHSEELITVRIKTNLGAITLKLNAKKAPKTVENFLRYAEEGFYENTIFHRVIKNYIIQGGGYTTDYKKKIPSYDSIPNESNNGLKNIRGTISMARSSIDPESATTQFFINIKDNSFLDYQASMYSEWGYTVFGYVIGGMNIVDEIQNMETIAAGSFKKNVPKKLIVIKQITIVKDIVKKTLPKETILVKETIEMEETNKQATIPKTKETSKIIEKIKPIQIAELIEPEPIATTIKNENSTIYTTGETIKTKEIIEKIKPTQIVELVEPEQPIEKTINNENPASLDTYKAIDKILLDIEKKLHQKTWLKEFKSESATTVIATDSLETDLILLDQPSMPDIAEPFPE